MDILHHLLHHTSPTQTKGTLDQEVCWEYLTEGVISFSPTQYTQSVVISAGIHGNETAPIELLSRLCQGLFEGSIGLAVRLLVIFGNPDAIRLGIRYIDDDINRLFLGTHPTNPSSIESRRVKTLKQVVQTFFDDKDTTERFHYDLHTAIRSSLLPTFALLPNSTDDMPNYDTSLLETLSACNLDAIIYHTTDSTTFTSFTLNVCHAHAATLELGKALPFGQNVLADFEPTYQTLKAIVSNDTLPKRQKRAIAHFVIEDIIIKNSENFRLTLDKNTPNFTKIRAGNPIATDDDTTHQVDYDAYTLFLNADVKVGLRAGMLMKQVECPPH